MKANENSATALELIRRIDERLLAAVTGQEREAAAWMEERRNAVEQYLSGSPAADGLEELQERTRRLEDRFLHWRRSSIMELSMIEKHARFLHEQHRPAASSIHVRINLSA